MVKIDGQVFAEYVTDSSSKPVLWPLIGPTGKPVTRAWPMAKTGPGGWRRDHPHHRSLWFAFGDINGIEFWPGKGNPKVRNRIKHLGFTRIADEAGLP